MSPKEKTIIQIIKETLITGILVVIIMGLPMLLVIADYEKWNEGILSIILGLNVVTGVTLFALIGNNL